MTVFGYLQEKQVFKNNFISSTQVYGHNSHGRVSKAAKNLKLEFNSR